MATLKDIFKSGKPYQLIDLIRRYDIQNFVETGTGKGDTLDYVLGVLKQLDGFRQIISIELEPVIAQMARDRFAESSFTCQILQGDSPVELAEHVPTLYGNTLFFLDAHFPGADFHLKGYMDEPSNEIRLPLEREINAICLGRDCKNDVFIIDDLRIYEIDNFEMGNISKEDGALHTGLGFVYNRFNETHEFYKSLNFSGFLVLLPKVQEK
jgi:hypothetical protein